MTRSRWGSPARRWPRTWARSGCTIGALEVAHTGQLEQCGAAQAAAACETQSPIGAPVQLRSLLDSSYDDYSDGRIVRSIYAQDGEGNWFDTSRGTVSDGGHVVPVVGLLDEEA